MICFQIPTAFFIDGKNFLSQLLNIEKFNDAKKIETHTAEPFFCRMKMVLKI
jgi:hypothetical protein